jgi:hypothetical protein
MKRLIVVLLAALSLSACASGEGKFRIFDRGGKEEPSEQTVKAFIRLGQEEKARQWLLRRGVSDARIDELIVLALDAVARERAECEGREVCP